jgi:hypothetical protein
MSGIIGDDGQRSGTISRSFKVRAGAFCKTSVADNSFDTVALHNVSSVGIAGSSSTNYYTMNFATPMPDANYIAVVGSGRLKASTTANASMLMQAVDMTRTTSAVQFQNLHANSSPEFLCVFNCAIIS